MAEAIFTNTTESGRLSLTETLASTIGINEPCAKPAATDRDALRALADGADLLGVDPDGSAWLLIRTTPQLVEWLATMDGGAEDREDDDPGEDNGDHELDTCDDEPDADSEPNGDEHDHTNAVDEITSLEAVRVARLARRRARILRNHQRL